MNCPSVQRVAQVWSSYLIYLLPIFVPVCCYDDLTSLAYEHYDYSILDPYTVYGSPYGGFSRNSRSRLASLPLLLPEINDEIPEDDGFYMEVRDASGRAYVCGVFREDRLDPKSVTESMFTPPRFRQNEVASDQADMDESADQIPNDGLVEQTPTGHGSEEVAIDATGDMLGTGDVSDQDIIDDAQDSGEIGNDVDEFEMGDSSHEPERERIVNADEQNPDQMSSISFNEQQSSAQSETFAHEPLQSDDDAQQPWSGPKRKTVEATFVAAQLLNLERVCGQIHKGWWSYEWCFEDQVSQFHVDINPKTSEISVKDITSLGSFDSRSIETDLSSLPPNELAQDTPEIARVTDVYTDGDTCPDTLDARVSYVNIVCCSDRIAEHRMGLLHRDGKQLTSTIAAVYDIQEDPDRICTYNFTVCTTLLCAPSEEEEDDDEDVSGDALAKGKKSDETSVGPKTDGTIQGILDASLKGNCLQTNPNGWWSYEFCHQQSIRQYHEDAVTQRTKSGTTIKSRVVSTEFILGKYKAEPRVSKEEEWQLVVNATQSSGKEVEGTYYKVEYVGGDVCDDPDVTDSAIVAGSSGSGGIARSASVRYFCGVYLTVAISEDSTCHYTVDVKVPELCKHPLFKVPVRQKQIVKCVPAEA